MKTLYCIENRLNPDSQEMKYHWHYVVFDQLVIGQQYDLEELPSWQYKILSSRWVWSIFNKEYFAEKMPIETKQVAWEAIAAYSDLPF